MIEQQQIVRGLMPGEMIPLFSVAELMTMDYCPVPMVLVPQKKPKKLVGMAAMSKPRQSEHGRACAKKAHITIIKKRDKRFSGCVQKIADMHSSGATNSEIARAVNIPRCTVIRYMTEEMGL